MASDLWAQYVLWRCLQASVDQDHPQGDGWIATQTAGVVAARLPDPVGDGRLAQAIELALADTRAAAERGPVLL
jgi:hypothetical protein